MVEGKNGNGTRAAEKGQRKKRLRKIGQPENSATKMTGKKKGQQEINVRNNGNGNRATENTATESYICCPFFCLPFFSVVVSSGSFLLPFFYPLISCCPIFPLPDFPAAQFAIAIFSVVIISDINFLLPFSPNLSFSGSPIFRCRFCRESLC